MSRLLATVQSLWSEESKCSASQLTKHSAPAPWQGLILQFCMSRCALTGSEKRQLRSFSFPNIEDIRLCICVWICWCHNSLFSLDCPQEVKLGLGERKRLQIWDFFPSYRRVLCKLFSNKLGLTQIIYKLRKQFHFVLETYSILHAQWFLFNREF